MDIDDIGSLKKNVLDKIVYVVGPARGGTTILKDSIGIHDEILTFPGMTHFMNHVWRYRNKVHNRLFRQIYTHPGFYQEKEILDSLETDKRDCLKKILNDNFTSKDLRKMWINYPLIYGLDKNHGKTADNIKYWVEKANDCNGLNLIRQAFPRGKFIFIFRDPRSSVLSLSRRLANEERTEEISPDLSGIIRSCIYWRNMTQKMLGFSRKHPDISLKVRFEDFILQPHKVLNEVFDFLQVTSLTRDHIDRLLSDMGYRATNQPGESDTGISRKPLERWKKLLQDDELCLIEQLTLDTAAKLGYETSGTDRKQTFHGILNHFRKKSDKLNIAIKLIYLNILEMNV